MDAHISREASRTESKAALAGHLEIVARGRLHLRVRVEDDAVSLIFRRQWSMRYVAIEFHGLIVNVEFAAAGAGRGHPQASTTVISQRYDRRLSPIVPISVESHASHRCLAIGSWLMYLKSRDGDHR